MRSLICRTIRFLKQAWLEPPSEDEISWIVFVKPLTSEQQLSHLGFSAWHHRKDTVIGMDWLNAVEDCGILLWYEPIETLWRIHTSPNTVESWHPVSRFDLMGASHESSYPFLNHAHGHSVEWLGHEILSIIYAETNIELNTFGRLAR